MGINDKIKKLGNYFKKMNIAEGIIFITVTFPQGWVINHKITDDYDVKVMPTEDRSGYYFAAKMDNGFDNIFSAINETISYNEVAGLKKAFFIEKVKELQSLFEEESLDVLQTLEFKVKKKKTKTRKENNEIIEENLCPVG